jgi:hypothetical protein
MVCTAPAKSMNQDLCALEYNEPPWVSLLKSSGWKVSKDEYGWSFSAEMPECRRRTKSKKSEKVGLHILNLEVMTLLIWLFMIFILFSKYLTPATVCGKL